jgi:K+-transporting ATPase KdpF subunit
MSMPGSLYKIFALPVFILTNPLQVPMQFCIVLNRNAMNIIGIVIALFLLGYLLFSLVKPEKF